jgi:hypothetical protein
MKMSGKAAENHRIVDKENQDTPVNIIINGKLP